MRRRVKRPANSQLIGRRAGLTSHFELRGLHVRVLRRGGGLSRLGVLLDRVVLHLVVRLGLGLRLSLRLGGSGGLGLGLLLRLDLLVEQLLMGHLATDQILLMVIRHDCVFPPPKGFISEF